VSIATLYFSNWNPNFEIMRHEEITAYTNYIICGRGQCKYDCEGNKVFRRSVAKHVNSYISFETRAKKSSLIQGVVEELRSLGMVFMIISDDGISMKELSPAEVRRKVGHRFRDAVRAVKQVKVTPKKRKYVRSQEKPFRHLGKLVNFSLLTDSLFSQEKQSGRSNKTVFTSDTLMSEDARHPTQSIQSRKINFLLCPNSDDNSLNALNTSTTKDDDMYDWLSLSSDDYEDSMSSKCEIVSKREAIFSDLLELIDASPNTDYGEDFEGFKFEA
jgi:hypothetical protein